MNPQEWAAAALQALLSWSPPLGLLPAPVNALVATPNGKTALAMLALAGVLVVAGRPRPQQAPSRARSDDEEAIKRPDNTAWWQRHIWWHLFKPHDSMRVDGLVINRSRKRHCAWLGPTGAGKSSAVAAVRLDGKLPTLIVTPDISDPLIAAARCLPKWFHWRVGEGPQPINFLIGSPQEVAERLTEVFRSGGLGAWKRTARLATTDVIRAMDNQDVPRSLVEIGRRLKLATDHDRDLKMVCAGWVSRFLDLADQFGDSIDEGGVDLAELLRDGYTIVIDNDAFEHAALTEDVVSLGLSEAKRCAARVPGGFRLIFEEAGQLGDRIELAAPFFRAGRRRRISVDVLTQAETDLVYQGSDAVTANLATRVYFAQEEKPLQRKAADRLGLKLSDLDPATMADFTAWIAHGRIRRLVRFPKPPEPSRNGQNGQHKPGVKRDAPGGVYEWIEVDPDLTDAEVSQLERVLGLPAHKNGVPMLPGGRVVLPEYIAGAQLGEHTAKRRTAIFGRFSGTWNAGGQWLWTGATNKGYGKTSYLNMSGIETHFLMWAWQVLEERRVGRPGDLEVFYARHPEIPEFEWPELDDELVVLRGLKKWMDEPFGAPATSFARNDPRRGVKLSIDHKCPGFPNTLCGNPADLWLATSRENSQWRHERRRGAGRLKVEAMGG